LLFYTVFIEHGPTRSNDNEWEYHPPEQPQTVSAIVAAVLTSKSEYSSIASVVLMI